MTATPPFRVSPDSELLLIGRRLSPQDGQFKEPETLGRFSATKDGWSKLSEVYHEKSARRDYAGFSFTLRIRMENIPVHSFHEVEELMSTPWIPQVVGDLPMAAWRWIVIHGTPWDGMVHTGPFPTEKSANEWVKQELTTTDYWVIDLECP